MRKTLVVGVIVTVLLSSMYAYFYFKPLQFSVGHRVSERSIAFAVKNLENDWERVRYIEELDFLLPPLNQVLYEDNQQILEEYELPNLKALIDDYGIDTIVINISRNQRDLIIHSGLVAWERITFQVGGKVTIIPCKDNIPWTFITFTNIIMWRDDSILTDVTVHDVKRVPEGLLIQYDTISNELSSYK